MFNWREFLVFVTGFVLAALIFLLIFGSIRVTLVAAGFFVALWMAYVIVYLIFSMIFGKEPFDLMKMFIDKGGRRRGPRRTQDELRIRQGRADARARERARLKPTLLARRRGSATVEPDRPATRFKRSRPTWRDEDKWGIDD